MQNKKVSSIRYSDRDSRDRQFKWTVFTDGSALSEELTWHTGDPARPVKVTWSESHDKDSEMANSIKQMCECPRCNSSQIVQSIFS